MSQGGGGERTWFDRDSNPGSLAYRLSTLSWATKPDIDRIQLYIEKQSLVFSLFNINHVQEHIKQNC